jgi:hypothetical protein
MAGVKELVISALNMHVENATVAEPAMVLLANLAQH